LDKKSLIQNTHLAKLEHKKRRLREIIAGFDHIAVAFSGGVDSSYLLATCVDVLGSDKVWAVTLDSPLLTRAELETACRIAKLLGAQHRIIPFDELNIPEIAANPPRRCYYCKRARFRSLIAVLAGTGITQLVHGENADDHLDYRPGSAAARELGIQAPLAEAGLTKKDIRALSKQRGLPTWNQPPAPCLATRFPYGVPLTREGLKRVERAETLLLEILGLRQLRVRDHYPVARIEVEPKEITHLASQQIRSQITQHLHNIGYRYVTLDLDGYRMGSLNEDITEANHA